MFQILPIALPISPTHRSQTTCKLMHPHFSLCTIRRTTTPIQLLTHWSLISHPICPTVLRCWCLPCFLLFLFVFPLFFCCIFHVAIICPLCFFYPCLMVCIALYCIVNCIMYYLLCVVYCITILCIVYCITYYSICFLFFLTLSVCLALLGFYCFVHFNGFRCCTALWPGRKALYK